MDLRPRCHQEERPCIGCGDVNHGSTLGQAPATSCEFLEENLESFYLYL